MMARVSEHSRHSPPTGQPMTTRSYVLLLTLTLVVVRAVDAQTPATNVPARRARAADAAAIAALKAARDQAVARQTQIEKAGKPDISEFTTELRASVNTEVASLNKALVAAESDSAKKKASESDLGTWSGASVAYNFASGGDAAEKLSVAGQLVMNAWAPSRLQSPATHRRIRIPIVGNLAKPGSGMDKADQLKSKADELIASSSGIYAGVQPYVEWNYDTLYRRRLFATALVRTNSLKDVVTDSSFSATTGRFSLGGDITLNDFSVGTGLASLEVSYTRFRSGDYQRAYGVDRRSLLATEAMVILPIANQVGLLAQAVRNHTESRTVWRMGVALKPGE